MAQKTSSHVKAQTVNPGQKMTFTYEIFNTNAVAVTLEVVEQLPEHITYLSGAQNVSGNTLRWEVTVPAEERVQVSYQLKVNKTAPCGAVIQSANSTVGGVRMGCPGVQVRRTLTDAQRQRLIAAIGAFRENENTLTGLELVNKLYEEATGVAGIFAQTDAQAVAEGPEGIFAKKQMSPEEQPLQVYQLNTGSTYQRMVAPTLYGGYRMWTPMWQHDRTRLPKEQDLQVGDVLIGRTLTGAVLYLYAGEQLGFVDLTTAALEPDTLTAQRQLESLPGYGYYFAILRPSMAL